jgi:ATP-dependent 26S proteasome regulatory subunit
MTRANDNRSQVSAILNITDGMFADFLRTHVICTINCPSSRLDPALLRPGRLVAHRNFGRLPAAQARKLSIYLNKQLEPADDYSLAEVFAGAGVHEETPRLVGFAA